MADDDRGPRGRHRLGLGLVDRSRPPAAEAGARRCAQRREHEHGLDERVGGGADQVAPVGRPEQEAELELYEAEGALAVAG